MLKKKTKNMDGKAVNFMIDVVEVRVGVDWLILLGRGGGLR